MWFGCDGKKEEIEHIYIWNTRRKIVSSQEMATIKSSNVIDEMFPDGSSAMMELDEV